VLVRGLSLYTETSSLRDAVLHLLWRDIPCIGEKVQISLTSYKKYILLILRKIKSDFNLMQDNGIGQVLTSWHEFTRYSAWRWPQIFQKEKRYGLEGLGTGPGRGKKLFLPHRV
jgi:hypothetical protein